MTYKAFLRCGVIATAVALVQPATALAQTSDTGASAGDDSAIIVTGSRIRRNPLNDPSPVVTVDQEALAKTGLTSIADALQRLPGSAGGLNSKFNNSGNLGNPPDGGGVGAGSAEIDLRYLGAKRTLVLVDGMRWVNGASASGIPASVDLNSIPGGMIERIEVLQSGASPQYGSDAIAGVVNIITKTHQDGLKASAQYGQFRQGDGQTQDYELSYGINAPASHIVVGLSYTKQDSVSARDRAISQYPNPGSTSCLGGGCSSGTPLGRFYNVAGQDMTLKQAVAGKPAFDPTDPFGPNSDFKAFTTLDRFNFAPYNYFETPQERFGMFILAKQELTDTINLRVKMVYNHRHSQNQAAFLPLFIGPDAGNGNLLDTISIDATNPYNPFGYTLASGTNGTTKNYGFIGRRLVEAGQRTYTQNVDTMLVTSTLDGSFMVGSHKWYWDVNGTIAYNDAKQVFTGNVNAQRLAEALGPVSVCNGLPGCVPFNIFGGVGSVTPAMLAYVGFNEHDKSNQSMVDGTANLSGDLFDLPAGPVGFAIGYEHRDMRGSFTPDPVITAGLGADIPAQPASGQFNTDEVYGEVRVPILSDKPFFQMLEADGAARYSNYSTFGGNTTLSGTLLWKPVADLLLRGSYSESLRAPSIGELYGSLSRFDQPLADPCSNIAGSPYQSSATVRANCTANGVPADGSYAEPSGQLPVLTGGNTALQPETATTWLVGAVYSPAWARTGGGNLSLSVDYYKIELNGAIASIDAGVLLNRCAELGDTLSCNAVQRSSSGFISRINGVLLNSGAIKTDGIDVALTGRLPQNGLGRFGFTLNSSFLFKYQESLPATTGFTLVERQGTERGSPDQAFPKFKATGIIDWSLGDVSTSLTGRYIDSVVEASSGNKLNSRFYTDVQFTYRPSFLDSKWALTLGVNNLFNQGPPPCFDCSLNNYDPTTYDVPGQFGYARITYKM